MKTGCFPIAAIPAALVLVAAALAVPPGAHAGQAGGACVHRPAPAGALGKRVAIVIGDGAYTNGIPALPNPAHDAEAVTKAAGALGFEVFLSIDASAAALQRCLDEATAGLAAADVAMLYYSGHGIQIEDSNYLVATDAGAGDLKRGFVAVQPIVEAMQGKAKATLVLLDACRNNPLKPDGTAGLSVSLGRGLSRVKDPAVPADAPAAGTPGVTQARGLMVAYATSPNAVAQDGTGSLSPFTGAFVKLVGTSGYSIQRVMGEVNRSVGEATDWRQTPWMKSSLTGELKLGGGQTLAEAQSASDNHANRSMQLLDTDGRREPAVVEALKGLPAAPDAATLTRFPKAYLALYRAMQGGETFLPLDPGMNLVAVSTRDRAAVYHLNPDYQSGTMTLFAASQASARQAAVVAKLDIGSGGGSERFTFSSHGKLLAVSLRNGVGIFDGLDGRKLFEVRGRGGSMEFSPDESRLLLTEGDPGKLTLIDIASAKPAAVVTLAQLDPSAGRGHSTYIEHATFGGGDRVCFVLRTSGGRSGDSGEGIYGVFDLREMRTVRLRRTKDSSTTIICDPADRYLVRTSVVGASDKGMEIWDLAADTVRPVDAPIVNIMAIAPDGGYVSVLASSHEVEGFYNLATGERGYPPHVPDGFWVLGARVRGMDGGLGSQDTAHNPWRDWPDETLYGPALVEKAMASLSAAQRDEIARERIGYSVAANP